MENIAGGWGKAISIASVLLYLNKVGENGNKTYSSNISMQTHCNLYHFLSFFLSPLAQRQTAETVHDLNIPKKKGSLSTDASQTY